MKRNYRRRIAFLLSLVLVLSCLASCTNTSQDINTANENAEPTVENGESSQLPKKYLIQHTDQKAISVELPDFVLEDAALNELVTNYIKERISGWGWDVQLTAADEDIAVQPQDYEEYLNLDCRVTYLSDEIASVVFEGMLNGRTAAHPMHLFTTLNIDLAAKKQIQPRDLIPVNEALYAAFLHYGYLSMAEKANAEFLAGFELKEYCDERAFYAGFYEADFPCVYFTETGVGISYEVEFALGNHQETEIPYSVVGITSLEEALDTPSTQISLYHGRLTFVDNGDYTDTLHIYDKNGDVVDEITDSRSIHLIPLTEGLLYVGRQAGNSLATRGGYFYNFETDEKSDHFYYVLDYTESLVVCGGTDSVTVFSMFGDSYYLELTQFQHPLSQSVEPIRSAQLSVDGKNLTVTYCTGENYEIVTQEFALT